MAGIQGINGAPEVANTRANQTRTRKEEEVRTEVRRDGVELSSEAKDAATAGRVIKAAGNDNGIRADKVAAARERLEQGSYKQEHVLRVVARNLLKYMD